ncbi:MAG: hypothetical protein IJH63_10110 [Methanobrevibacter sp.]|nr:hypothetical protein [Methanosphaera sp.]MBR0371052.1 hypothetical protein [Methanobrevibacter sp.]
MFSVEHLCPDKILEERLNIVNQLIVETEERLKNYPEVLYPREHWILKMRLHSYELDACKLKEALFEETVGIEII